MYETPVEPPNAHVFFVFLFEGLKPNFQFHQANEVCVFFSESTLALKSKIYIAP